MTELKEVISRESDQAEDLLRLRKLLASQEEAQDDDGIFDILDQIERMKLPLKVIKASGVYKQLHELTLSNQSERVQQKARAIIKKLRKLTKEKKPKNELSLPTDDVRRRVCTFLKETFKTVDSISDEKKTSICVEIEEAMYTLFAEDPQSKGYKAKFRSLKFNLSKNAELRQDLLEGTLSGRALVDMPVEDLANKEKREQRRKEQQAIFDASRSDWLDANRDAINKQAGIKATGGLFRCFNCKSTKTTHYQKQTRSADEPMTVFVQCTNCGKRWRS